MTGQPSPFKSYFGRLSFIHKAISISATGVTAVLFFLTNGGNTPAGAPTSSPIMLYILSFALLSPAVIYMVVVRKLTESAKAAASPAVKAKRYQVALLVLWAGLEGGTMVSAVLGFINKNPWFFIPAILLIAVLLRAFPSKAKMQNDLALSQEEMDGIEKEANAL
jgi:hypothetical protein